MTNSKEMITSWNAKELAAAANWLENMSLGWIVLMTVEMPCLGG